MNFEVIQSNRGNPMIVFKNQKYKKGRTLKSGLLTWRCIVNGCTATTTTNGEKNMLLSESETHGHDDKENAIQKQKFRNNLKRKATADLSEKPLKIIRKELSQNDESFSMELDDLPRFRKAIYRVRGKIMLRVPKSRLNAIELASTRSILYQEEQCVYPLPESEITIVAFKENLSFLARKDVTLIADGTFTYTPDHFYQWYTVHGALGGHYVPLVYAFLPSKEAVVYEEFWRTLKSVCSENHLDLNPRLVHLDYEVATHAGIRAVFPEATIRGCRFHLGQSWWRKLQKKKSLVAAYKEEGNRNGKWLHVFFELSYLPSSEVPAAFNELLKDVPLDTDYFEFAEYIRDNYVETTRFPPHLWASAPTALDIATTNSAENFHSHLSNEFYKAHPPLFKAISSLIENQSIVSLKIAAAIQKKPPVRQKENVDREAYVIHLYQRYSSPATPEEKISLLQFLRSMGYRFVALS